MIRAEIHDIGSKNKNTILNLCDWTSGPGEYMLIEISHQRKANII